MPCQLAALGAGVGAEFALVRLLARVTSPVNGQVAAVLERLSTVFAGVVAASPNQVLANIGVKDSVKSALLSQSPHSTWLHRWHLHPIW